MLSGQGLVTERPVQRDPASGHIVIHPAYEGWAPRPVVTFTPGEAVRFTLGALAFVAFVAVMLRVRA